MIGEPAPRDRLGEPAMTPQERQLVDELFDRLAKLEDTPRDPDAERAIADGLRVAPHAVYALVQTTLVQDEALKRASARIQELEGGEPQEQPRGFLDSMRDTLFGREERRGSVPTVRPGGQGSSGVWGSGQGGPPPPPGYGSYPQAGPAPVGTGGSSFLGTAAAGAAGVIGGAMLMNGIRSMFGHSYGGGSTAYDPGSSLGSPWGGGGAGSAANSDLARQAGIDDIGTSRSASRGDESGDSGRAGFFGGDDNDDPTDTAYDDSNDDDTDVAGDFDGGDTDTA
jgi:hypothetical protein